MGFRSCPHNKSALTALSGRITVNLQHVNSHTEVFCYQTLTNTPPTLRLYILSLQDVHDCYLDLFQTHLHFVSNNPTGLTYQVRFFHIICMHIMQPRPYVYFALHLIMLLLIHLFKSIQLDSSRREFLGWREPVNRSCVGKQMVS